MAGIAHAADSLTSQSTHIINQLIARNRELEAALSAARADLEQRVEARTHDLAQRTAQLEDRTAELAAANAQLVELQAALREQAIRDPLTGLYNRRYLDEAMPRELARADRARQPIGVLLLDLDDFKRINDEHGHAAGDTVLEAVAAVLRANIRSGDLAFR
jgi:PleD family two-component response regulator